MIRFTHVSKSYPRTGTAVDDVSLYVGKGEFLFFTGPSGAGKTTASALLMRFFDPLGGVIRLDVHDVRSLRLASLPRTVALVEHEPLLFRGTYAENIRCGNTVA